MDQNATQPTLKQLFFAKCRMQNKSWKTRDAYWGWCVKFMRWHWQRRGGRDCDWIHPRDMGVAQIEAYLSWLANDQNVSPKTQDQAFYGIIFLYRQVLGIKVEGIEAARAKPNFFIPSVLSVDEIVALLECLSGRNRLVAYLCYGAGLRIGEVFDLRCQNIDFANNFIHVRQAKGHKDRIVQLPHEAVPFLRMQLAETQRLHALDVSKNRAHVPLPYAYEKKSPRWATELGWYFLFSSQKFLDQTNNKKGWYGRWHLDSTTFTDKLAEAVREAQPPILKRVTAHTLRHSFATHLMNRNVPIVQIAELMGHKDISTTQIYTHCMEHGATSVLSPLDALPQKSQHRSRQHAG